MKTIKITLAELVSIKDLLEKDIDKLYDKIRKQNSIIKGNKRDIDITKTLEEVNKKSEQLIKFVVIIQETNLKTVKGSKHSNAYYIKRLSELKRLQKMFFNMKTRDEKFLTSDQKLVYFDTVIDEESKNLHLKSINETAITSTVFPLRIISEAFELCTVKRDCKKKEIKKWTHLCIVKGPPT
jgi:hypothetical protein